MAIELEFKFKIKEVDKERLENRVALLLSDGEFKEFVKEDLYFKKDDFIRIRCDDKTLLITKKIKNKTEQGYEINNEDELTFTTDFKESFIKLLNFLGYKESFRKLKKGRMWHKENLTVEIVYVEKLGWFIELEILLKDEAKAEEIKESWLKLENIKRSLGLDDSNLESKNYSELLKEAKH